MRTVQVVLYRGGDGYVAQCLDVDLVTGGNSEAEARANLREALELYFAEPGADAHYLPVTEARVEAITLAHARDPIVFKPTSGGPCLQ
jgi:predicted RNase H-like HicB family nuclease